MRPALLLVGLTASSAFISLSAPARRQNQLRAAPGGDGGPKRSLADAISAFSKGALSRDELEGAVKAEEAAAAAALAKEKAIRDAKEALSDPGVTDDDKPLPALSETAKNIVLGILKVRQTYGPRRPRSGSLIRSDPS